MIRRPPRSTLSSSSAASDVYKRQMGACVSEENVSVVNLNHLPGKWHSGDADQPVLEFHPPEPADGSGRTSGVCAMHSSDANSSTGRYEIAGNRMDITIGLDVQRHGYFEGPNLLNMDLGLFALFPAEYIKVEAPQSPLPAPPAQARPMTQSSGGMRRWPLSEQHGCSPDQPRRAKDNQLQSNTVS
eukprot:TRINITY_DN45158_c0_g1_i2.p1 TRINITY_DN45158_c0_g1~~TRINITY_DN45158_c0_g1_i2.p1  ORF type:complete len:186 (-),score=21.61 TRINITY_DN45158_c0_g1_i2:303-860(-)